MEWWHSTDVRQMRPPRHDKRCTHRSTGESSEADVAGVTVARAGLEVFAVGVGRALDAGALVQPPAGSAGCAHAAGAGAAVSSAHPRRLPACAGCALAVGEGKAALAHRASLAPVSHGRRAVGGHRALQHGGQQAKQLRQRWGHSLACKHNLESQQPHTFKGLAQCPECTNRQVSARLQPHAQHVSALFISQADCCSNSKVHSPPHSWVRLSWLCRWRSRTSWAGTSRSWGC